MDYMIVDNDVYDISQYDEILEESSVFSDLGMWLRGFLDDKAKID